MTSQAVRIDIHQHLVPPVYREALAGAGIDSIGRVPLPGWSEQAMLDGMDQLGIAKAVLSVSAPGVYFGDQAFATALATSVNDALADLRGRYPDRVGGFATLPLPDPDAALAEWERARANGLDGAILLTNYGGKYIGHPDFAPLLEELGRQQALVFLHPTLPPGLDKIDLSLPPPILEFVFETTRAIADMIFSGAFDRYSGINWIAAHLAGTLPFVAGRLAMIEHSPRAAYAAFRERGQPVADYLKRLYYDTAVSSSHASLKAVLEVADPDRLLFGSDLPFLPMAFAKVTSEWLATTSELDAAAQRAVACGNAKRLLG